MDKTEFDRFADEYHADLESAVTLSGETPEFFAEYKVVDAAGRSARAGLVPETILDFGSGVGSSVPYFRRLFPHARLVCADVSRRSLDVAKARFDEQFEPLLLPDREIPLPDASIDLVFSACVFHHIPHSEHRHWLEELSRVTRPGGILVLFEHNPWNPLTVKTVNDCPFDENAVLVSARELGRVVAGSGWSNVERVFRLFFPNALRVLRPVERWIGWLPVGAQYYVVGQKRPAT